ncbi:MAG: hypothetical protein IPK28_19845 [Devosia sp.]|nr:hypothetical protein [Devosia sp.]
MAHYRTNPSNRVRGELAWLRTMAGAALTVMASFGLTNAAVAPDNAMPVVVAPADAAPRLSQVGKT